MQMHDLLSRYETWLACSDRASTTQQLYLWAVRSLLSSLPADSTEETLTEATFRRFYVTFRQSHRPRSAKSLRASLIVFGHFLLAEGFTSTHPAASLPLPKTDEVIRRVPSEQTLANLLLAPSRFPNAYRGALAKACLHLLIFTGVRCAELLSLNVADVDLPRKCLHVRHGKGDKPRTIYYSDECAAAVREYLKVRPISTSPILLLRNPALPVGDAMLRSLLVEASLIAGIPRGQEVRPHDLRHAYASGLNRGGAPLTSIAKLLGHNNLSVTQIYLHDTEADLRRAAEGQAARLRALQPEKGIRRRQELRRSA